jgi:RHS repeat-associated protein
MKHAARSVALFVFFLTFLIGDRLAAGQDYVYATGNPMFAVNIPVENGFINVANGNLHLEIPLATHKQRGALSLNEKLVYDSRIWMIGHYSNYYWWPTNVPNTSQDQGGWRFVTGAETGTLSYTMSSSSTQGTCQSAGGGPQGTQNNYVYIINWADPSGTNHIFNAYLIDDENTCGYPIQRSIEGGFATDGSGYQVRSDQDGNPIVLDNNGTQVYPQVIDRNGNYWSSDANGNLIDDVGRTPVIVTKNGNVTYYDVLAANGPINNNGMRVRYTVTTAPISISTAFHQSAVAEWSGTINPVQSIQLPDGSSYTFTYDNYGEPTSITLPTGGVITYGWTNYFDSYQNANRWLSSRAVGNNPSTTFTPSVISQCSNNGTGCQEQVIMHKPSGDETVYQLTLNNGAWNTSTTAYNGSANPSAAIVTVENVYDFSNACPSQVCSGAEYITKSSALTTLYGGGGMTQTQYGYSNPALGKPTSIKQWDFYNSTTPPSTPTRETDYSYSATGFDLNQVTQLDSVGNQVSQTTFSYTTSAALTSGVPQHGTVNAGGPYLHSVSQWLNTGGSVTTTYGMDDTGMVVSITDPKGNPASAITYQCANTLSYQVTNALNQTTTFAYDCNSGLITSAKDPNDTAAGRAGTVYQYEPVAGRLQSVTSPDGGKTSYTYPSSVEVDTAVLATPDPTISSQDIADSFGRPYQHISAGVSSETTYDTSGRVHCVTNPHFSTSSSTDGSTCVTTYDGLDRPKVQTQSDGTTTLQWSYNGNVTISADEAGHSWQRTSDAFGRLTNVVEPTGASTGYVYDALNNLRTVNQVGVSGDAPRTRSFVYDSLSRLTSSTNPENGVLGYGYLINGAPCSGDATLPCSKTDARGITTSYTYDALNRLTFKHYSDGTLTAAFGYDGKSETGATLPAASTNAIGRMSSSSNQVNVASIYSYDSVGRVIQQNYCIPGSCWNGIKASGTYDLAGNATSLTYPDGRTVSQGFDGAGRMSSVNYANWNGNSHSAPYLTVNPTNGYDPAGHLVSATMGNGLAMAAGYDNRERVGALAYGTTTQLLWGKQYQWSPNSNLQTMTDAFTGVQRQFGYDNLNRLKSAQDIVGLAQGADISPFPVGSGNTTTGSSSGATPVPSWTNPDDSNILLNPDTPGAEGWGVASATIIGGVLAPDGTTTASTFTANAGSTDTYLADQVSNPTLYDGETMTGSVWLRSPNGTQTVNLYLVEIGTAGYAIPAWKPVTVTTNWQQFQVSGQFQYGHSQIILQIGGGGSVISGQTVSLWGTKLEDSGTSGATVTNFLPYSQRLTASTWGINASASDNSATAPDGTNTAATVTATTDSYFVDTVPNPAPFSGLPVTGSIWMRSPSGPQTILLTLINVGANGWSTLGAIRVALSSDWQRFQVTGTNQGTLSELQLQIGGAETFMSGQSIQVWGAQMELASNAGPYVATGANAASAGTNLTNILPYSQQPNGPSWGIAAASGRVNAVAAPDGSMTGYEMTALPGVPDAYATDDAANPALYDGATVTGSIFMRSPSGAQLTYFYLAGENASGRTYLGTQAVQLTAQWQRFTITGQMPNGLTRIFLQAAGSGSLTSGQAIDIWGAQLELSNHAGPYVMTSALPVVGGQELTNLLPNSQQLNGPSWGVAYGSTTLSSATAPDGTMTAATVTAATNSPGTYAVDVVPNPSLYDEETVTASVYLRVASGTLNTGIYLVNVGTAGQTFPASLPVALTTTWQRFSVTGNNQNGLTELLLQIGGGATITSGQSIQVWGPQIVVGSAAAPYMPTISGTTNVVTNQPATLVPTGLSQVYSYDSFGNILQNGSFNSSYSGNNQMSGYAYDAAGNLLSDGLNVMTWDAESRMTSAGGATYIYDAEGNRVEKQGVGVTDTIYFGDRPLARLSAGSWTDLIYGPNGLLAEVPGTENGVPTYPLVDHLGTEIGMASSNGLLTNPTDYTPFGQLSYGTTNDPYRFTGLERDDETGFDHAMFRQYSSTTGRWLSPDPYNGSMDFNYPQSLNRYTYVGNMPLSGVDPSGLDPITISVLVYCGGASGACAGAASNPVTAIALGGLLVGAAIADLFTGAWFAPEFHGSLQPRPSNNECSVSSSSLDKYLGSKNSPMEGQGTNLMKSGAQYNLDPRLLVSLSGAETSFGNNITAGQFNAFNVLYHGLNSPFASFQSAINSVGHSLTNPRNGYDFTNTATLYGHYCSGAGCSAGLKNVNTFMNQQGANTNSLHYPCKKE